MITKEKVILALRGVKEPNLQKDLSQLNLLNVEILENKIKITVYLKEDVFYHKDEIEEKINYKIKNAFGQSDYTLSIDFVKVGDYSEVRNKIRSQAIQNLKTDLGKVIAITSGKGGVGKSTVAINLAMAFKELGYKVGLLDADVYGPSIPTAFGLEGQILQIKDEKIQPIEKYGIKLVSIGFMIPEVDTPLIWRGPMLHKAINEMVNQVEWKGIDYLVVDLPPGTGDAILSLNSSVKVTGAIVVSTPQKIAAVDVIKNINMLKTLSIPIIGIVENMSYVQCTDGQKIYLWGKDLVNEIAKKYEIEFLSEIPFIPQLTQEMETGNFLINENKKIFIDLAKKISNKLSLIPSSSS